MHATAHADAFLLLTTSSVAYQSLFNRWERLRRGVANNRVPDFLSSWTSAAFLLLPPPWVMTAIGLYYVADWKARTAGKGSRMVQLGKFIYSVIAVEVAAVVACVVARSGGFAAKPAAICVFVAINFGLVVLAVVLSGKRSILPMMFRPRSHVLEFAGHLIGAGLAAAMAWHSLLILAAVPLLGAVHFVASHDAMLATGAFNREQQTWSQDAWQFRASEMLSNSGYCSVIVVDVQGSTEPQRANILAASVGPACPVGIHAGYYVVLVESESEHAADFLADRIERFMAQAGVFVKLGIAVGGRGSNVGHLLSAGLDDLVRQLPQGSSAAG